MLRAMRSTRTEPAIEPVDIAELRTHLRFDSSEHDDYLAGLLKASRRKIENEYLWRCCINQTCVDYFDTLTTLELRWGTVQSITSITYIDTASASQTLSTSIYELRHANGVGYVQEKYDQSFPTVRGHTDDVVVTYVAGYGATASSVPDEVKHAIKLHAEWLYDGARGNMNEGSIARLMRALLDGQSLWRHVQDAS